jgi:nucleoside-diphosphate-sugar epimerase
MRFFVTGATGFIGIAVVRELQKAGHDVLGLARSDTAAEMLARQGAAVRRGDLSDTDGLARGARSCDGVIHLAFNHDFSRFQENIATDRKAVQSMADALQGSNKPLVIASGVLLSSGRTGTEADAADTGEGANGRGATETVVLAATERGVRGVVMRLSPTVHGEGDHGFIPQLIATARQTGVAAFVGDGASRWPAVHRLDAARLFRLAAEGAAPGTVLHAVAEEGIPMREIAETIGQELGIPTRSLSQEEAPPHFTWMARFVQIDKPTSSALTRKSMAWEPKQEGLLAGMREGGYFA